MIAEHERVVLTISVPEEGLEPGDGGSRPDRIAGKAVADWGVRATESRQVHRGSGDSMHDREIERNTGSPRDEGVTSTDKP